MSMASVEKEVDSLVFDQQSWLGHEDEPSHPFEFEKLKPHHPNATNPYTYKEWVELSGKPLSWKVRWSRRLIKEELSSAANPCLASSFGKDSIVILHLLRKFKPDIPVIFNNTGVQYRETYEYKKRLQERWNLNLIETKPDKNFWQCVDDHGLPQARHRHGSPRCCYYLKEKPTARVVKEKGFDVYFTGIRADESMNRRLLFLQYGAAYCTDKRMPWKVRKVHPIMLWNDDDIWNYIRRRGIEHNPAYDLPGVRRVGCAPCTGYRNWKESIGKTNPKMARHLIKIEARESKK